MTQPRSISKESFSKVEYPSHWGHLLQLLKEDRKTNSIDLKNIGGVLRESPSTYGKMEEDRFRTMLQLMHGWIAEHEDKP